MKLADWPSIRLVIPLIAGILLSDTILNTRAQVPDWCALLAISAVLAFAAIIFGGRWSRVCGFCMPLSFAVAGFALMAMDWNRVHVEWPESKCTHTAILKSYPLERERSWRLDLTLASGNQQGKNIYLYVPKDSAAQSLEPGQYIQFYGKVDNPSNQEGTTFDYAQYLYYHGISGTLWVPATDWRTLDLAPLQTLETRSIRLKHYMIGQYRNWGLESRALAVTAAVALGEKSHLDEGLRQVYSSSGVSHVLAVSGLHVGILCWFLYLIFPLRLFRRAPWLREFLVLATLWVYAFLIGLPMSITRSLLMFSLIGVCRAFKRENSSLNSLGVAAIIILMFNPQAVFDMSFQLSFCAVLAIVLFQDIIWDWLRPANRFLNYLWNIAALSIAAQIGTAPIIMYHFSGFSTYFLLSNLVMVPLMFVVVVLAVSLGITGWIPILGKLTVISLTWLVNGLTWFLERISRLPYARLDLSLDYAWQVWIIFAVVILVYLWIVEQHTHRLVQALACLVIAGIMGIIQSFVV